MSHIGRGRLGGGVIQLNIFDLKCIAVVFRANFRYAAVLMRDRFDQTRAEKDMRKLAGMVEAGEEEAFQMQHYKPFVFRVRSKNECHIVRRRRDGIGCPKY